MGLNINASDSNQLNQPEEKKKAKEEHTGSEKYTPETGYVVYERDQKIQRWIDKDGNWQEKVL